MKNGGKDNQIKIELIKIKLKLHQNNTKKNINSLKIIRTKDKDIEDNSCIVITPIDDSTITSFINNIKQTPKLIRFVTKLTLHNNINSNTQPGKKK